MKRGKVSGVSEGSGVVGEKRQCKFCEGKKPEPVIMRGVPPVKEPREGETEVREGSAAYSNCARFDSKPISSLRYTEVNSAEDAAGTTHERTAPAGSDDT
jgi:hypothetical protein